MVDSHGRVTELERTEVGRQRRIDNYLRRISYQGGIPLTGEIYIPECGGMVHYRNRLTGEERVILVDD